RSYHGKPKFLKKTGTSDFNIVAHHWQGIPIVTYGPGNSKFDHTPYEHIDLDEYLRSINILHQVLTEL
ncbi:M20/M25/M40 family metallo-hydrolase, partial [Patescibacteria group bacterium AH-259-L07]|nr:M20/M25/M40 family metallo-hydrolase [Patescibacteria group bacterium AH-259-L07]